ncbi:DNA cytosine methyltransferase [Herbaspirillum robiniae]|uniref:DNA (cytosine-5-)-methyltransferase n=1 Tax=Herbaspirillum robiniae TaxID=2014887 RepID=A0A246WKT6_9BURK|nr:DNA cytosine methyltransferase [Herbaspirillum robiniae]OWY26928.1 DNA (cytosine-5-)-methyltransferase [Herbaspirillum robiniae]
MSSSKKVIPIVDLFAGPGGLGEGFSSVATDPFRILVSAEMDKFAHRTLMLRAFYRILKRETPAELIHYYAFCNRAEVFPVTPTIRAAQQKAEAEALRLTLGDEKDNERLDKIISDAGLSDRKPWVLIGGPPCQAYSLVGRSRNKGNSDYRPENDHRHFLYKEYLRIIQKYRPAIFVMENVKGILSASVANKQMFKSILEDLADPDQAIGVKSKKSGYRIFSLSHDIYFDADSDFSELDPRKFIVRAEEYGVPQARHRVILVGVRRDLGLKKITLLKRRAQPSSVKEAIETLPPLRSHLSRRVDDANEWTKTVKQQFEILSRAAKEKGAVELEKELARNATLISGRYSIGGLRIAKARPTLTLGKSGALNQWYEDKSLAVWLNHEARGHMASDLMRYAYATTYAHVQGRSPKGHEDFNMAEGLKPAHANWESGKFADRFKVQMWSGPSTTVTSHISKDGHYFIHPDPKQCRSLTVREAARLQTFPDNYFFQGNRTQQYHQVGNAVPPFLACQIGLIVKMALDEIS